MATSRLAVETFGLPVTELRRGYRSAVYFWRAKKILEEQSPDTVVTMQYFQKNHAILCGMDHLLAILRRCTGRYSDLQKAEKLFDFYMQMRREADMYRSVGEYKKAQDAFKRVLDTEHELDILWVNEWDALDVRAMYDGDEIIPWEPVLQVTGPLSSFVHLESPCLGVMARGTKIATNTRRVVEAANGKPILFFADRFDHYATQGSDGYAAHIGGASSVASDAMGNWWGRDGVGTMPHALIAAFDGDVVAATAAFQKSIPGVPLIALVDFNNDCVTDSLLCAEAFGDDLWGVRLDTSENMVDRSLVETLLDGGYDNEVECFNYAPRFMPGDFKPTGVNKALVHNVRDALDANGYEHVKVVVSGGFNPEKIAAFEDENVPADVYAVGSSLLSGSNDFTADVVKPTAKQGRWFRDSGLLEKVE